MKAKSGLPGRRPSRVGPEEAEEVALAAFHRLAADPDRLGRFLAMSGLDPRTIRHAASEPGFLPAVLDHVVSDEPLLLAVAAETGRRPDDVVAAQRLLSPEPDWEP